MKRDEEITQAALDYANNLDDVKPTDVFSRNLCIALGQAFIKGAEWADEHQAEKDLLENKHETSWRLDEKLWEGIKDVEEASYQYMYDASNDWAYEIPTWEDVQDAFKAGSEWKENLELTWEDIYSIVYIERLVMREWFSKHNPEDEAEDDSNEVICKEILKRFNEQRKEK